MSALPLSSNGTSKALPEFPDVFVFDSADDEDEAAQQLAGVVADLGVERPFVVASSHGDRVTRALDRPVERIGATADQERASDLGSQAHDSGADAIVAAGGGRCLDVAKLAAARAGLRLITIPTQLSHDGICSPVAVVPAGPGCGESLGAVAPRAVFISLPTLLGAPVRSLTAGLGDLIANPLALRDWSLAAQRGLEEIDDRAWDLSIESCALIEPHLDSDPDELSRDAAFVRRLADALILSGLAMIWAGTSRPASGGEHEISHGIDELFGGRALHGAQVAFGCIFSVALHDEDHWLFRKRLARLGLPQHPRDLRLTKDETVKLLLGAPDTRPGRFTILEEANLDEASARSVVEGIWEDA